MGRRKKKKDNLCRYCGNPLPEGQKQCDTCLSKEELIHKLWSIGQEIKKDANRARRNRLRMTAGDQL